jgi:hypothetical protein
MYIRCTLDRVHVIANNQAPIYTQPYIHMHPKRRDFIAMHDFPAAETQLCTVLNGEAKVFLVSPTAVCRKTKLV